MENLIALLIFIAIAIIVLRIGGARLFRKRGPDYEKREGLFTPAELRFLQVLLRVVPDDAVVFGKVRVADVLKPVQRTDRKAWRQAFNRIAAKHLDFVLCDRESGALLCAIELNDRSHDRPDRQERDRFIVRACQGAGFPLLMLPTARAYDEAVLRLQLMEAIRSQNEPGATLPPRPIASKPVANGECPRCGGTLVRKRATRGNHAGQVFLACSHFPRCRYTDGTSEN